MNELFIRPAYTQSSDEVFLTASNQIVNDLRSTRPAFPYETSRQASKLVRPRAQAMLTSRSPEDFVEFRPELRSFVVG